MSEVARLWIQRQPLRLLIHFEEPRSVDWDFPDFEFFRIDYDVETKIVQYIFNMRDGSKHTFYRPKSAEVEFKVTVGKRLPGRIFTLLTTSVPKRRRFKPTRGAELHPN